MDSRIEEIRQKFAEIENILTQDEKDFAKKELDSLIESLNADIETYLVRMEEIQQKLDNK